MRWLAAGLMLCLAKALAAAPPVGEIRQVLAEQLIQPPDPVLLADLDARHLAEGLRRIDRYARWFSTTQYAGERAPDESGMLIGAAVARWGRHLVVVPYDRGPLARLGVTNPVYLLRIDGRDVSDADLADLAPLLHGEVGTAVRLELSSSGQPPGKLYTVRRERFRPRSVERSSAGGVPVIRVRDFVTRETRVSLRTMLQELGARPNLVVLDLRDCPGGDLFEALDAAGLFIEEGKILARTRDRAGFEQSYFAPGGPKFQPQRLVLWVGPGTASAGEIFAAALQQYGVALLIGERTYGKCSSQTDLKLSDGSVLRFTNREVLLPDGQTCSVVGVSPEVRVDAATMLKSAELLELSLISIEGGS